TSVHSFPTRRSSDLTRTVKACGLLRGARALLRGRLGLERLGLLGVRTLAVRASPDAASDLDQAHRGQRDRERQQQRLARVVGERSEEHTSELQSREN